MVNGMVNALQWKKLSSNKLWKPIPLIPAYTLASATLDWTGSIKYVGVTIQSDLKFYTHNIEEKGTKSKKILGGIKHLMYNNAPNEPKLPACTSLCRPRLENVDVVWDPHTKTNINKVEKIQDRAIRFISNLKRRKDSVSPPGRS